MVRSFFDKEFMNDPEKPFTKEYLLTSGSGAYSASTIAGCNTRKYHGLFIAPQPQIDDNDHVIISAIDEKIIYKQTTYEISTHKYPGTVYPEGYKFINEFFGSPVPKWVYYLDDCVLTKEIMAPENEDAVLIRYVVESATGKIQLNLSPFLSFRKVHELKRANLTANKKYNVISNGIQVQLYPEYAHACIQTSMRAEFIPAPDWYYNIEYSGEQKRGYDFCEDLFVPGYFSLNLKKGDKVVVYAGLEECNSKVLSTRYTNALKKKPVLHTEKDCLTHAAKQFIIKNDDGVKIKAGYYWFGSWGRDTFLSLPGLLLVTGHVQEFREVIKSSLTDLKNGLLPNIGRGGNAVYNSVDASLWFIWAIQQYATFTKTHSKIWGEYGRYLTEILENYKTGTLYNIKMESDGLIYAGQDGVALTWMDAVVNGKPVTPRTGKAVEINALWYNAICFCIEVAQLAGDNDFTAKWESYPAVVRQSFITVFSDKNKTYLADCVYNGVTDWSIRPNQVIALSMPYSPVPQYLRRSILAVIKEELLTPRGLRTLSAEDEKYKGKCEGSQAERDLAYHQGTVWPWLLGHFGEAYMSEYGSAGVPEIEKIHNDCKAMIEDPCLYTIPEIYNGDYPHQPVGAVAQAWSVAELLRIDYLLAKNTKNEAVYKISVV